MRRNLFNENIVVGSTPYSSSTLSSITPTSIQDGEIGGTSQNPAHTPTQQTIPMPNAETETPTQIEAAEPAAVEPSKEGEFAYQVFSNEEVELMVWNLLTKEKPLIDDESYKYWGTTSLFMRSVIYKMSGSVKLYICSRRCTMIGKSTGSCETLLTVTGSNLVSMRQRFRRLVLPRWWLGELSTKLDQNDFGIPYTPAILHGTDNISLLDMRSTCTGSNDNRMTEVVITKIKKTGRNRNTIYHKG
ncbi:hypothetical protein PIB30_085826 [Stylosanthes scabra]|uniref:Uncharacterized protein n=1 Tax=Stylosanthes scabra TaxID=79078 RepID=A0ABU6XU24_9FABA|nr:hypothetical protein [Stylosanthes scabra]